ncbi:L,D-transpeptidase family protein [Eggerthella sp. YY7918]|uniref:L,D-transpeptidase family protein n=1 Tax=Eggerthella sp. (strain YY7918) TaxID=502558 RepID=UPI0002E909FD|nr:L,D-transpeptidase family protein [Eggerthella sp. YY7918]
MDDTKKNKKTRGRHAGGSHAKSDGASEPKKADKQESRPEAIEQASGRIKGVSPAGKATVAMPAVPHPADSPKGATPARTAPEAGQNGFPPAGPMRPVDAVQPFVTKKRKKPLKVLGIVFGVLLGLLVVCYVGVAIFFSGRLMPNTTIGNLDVSMMTEADAAQALTKAAEGYTLTISGQGFSAKLSSADASLSLDEKKVVEAMLDDVNPWAWPLEITKQRDETDKLVAVSNGTGLEDTLRTAVEEFNAEATQPVNATIAYSSDAHAFVVEPEAIGTALDPEAVIKAADAALAELNPKVALTTEQLLQPTVIATDERLISAQTAANKMIAADMTLSMAGDTAAVVNADLISQWVRLGDDLTATLDEGALTAWVEQLAADCNTIGTERTYTRPDGKVVTVSGGSYGWTVDNEALLGIVRDGVANGTVDTVEVPCSTYGTAYNGVGQRDWGNRYCDIDLSEQYVRFYDDSGALVWESSCISGTPDGQHDTPTGVYWLNQKASPSKLIGYENGKKIYETTVQYWMPFVGNSVGLHDADWQPSFGGSMYANGYGSHGCVNLPVGMAAELYNIIQYSDVVVCHW